MESLLNRALCALTAWMFSLVAAGVDVDVYVRSNLQTNVLPKVVVAGTEYVSASAAVVDGHIFVGWTISPDQDDFISRDEDGRVYDCVRFTVYNETILTANYVNSALDDDHDGLPDGWELYWFGDLAHTGESDPDDDGYSLLVEYERGMNPLFREVSSAGGAICASGGLLQYSPVRAYTYRIRSDPDGSLLVTDTDVLLEGTELAIPDMAGRSSFVCWKVDGVEQRDEDGRALDAFKFAMPGHDVEIVACSKSSDVDSDSDGLPDGWELYWFGDLAHTGESDPDDDGYSLLVEYERGMNPLFREVSSAGGAACILGAEIRFNFQAFEQVEGVVVDGKYVPVFDEWDFGANLIPYVLDVNGDEKFDLVLKSDMAIFCFMNVGSIGNPEFVRNDSAISGFTVLPEPLSVLEGLELDVKPIKALSATTNGDELLVSDVEGRIWYYLALRA